MLGGFTPSLSHVHRDVTDIPNQSYRFHRFQSVIGDVNFPPVEPLAGGCGVIVMVVMPSFPERNQRQPKIVTTVVSGFIPLETVLVRERVDRAGAMDEGNRRDEKPPNQHLRTVGSKTRCVGFEEGTEPEHGEAAHSRYQDVKSI